MKKVLLSVVVLLMILGGCFCLMYYYDIFGDKEVKKEDNNYVVLIDLVGKNIDEVKDYAEVNNIEISIDYEYDFDVPKDVVIDNKFKVGDKIKKGEEVSIIVSMGSVPHDLYRENNVNELGDVPIMMYHGIKDMLNSDTKYTGGNVDKDGYTRTAEAFRNDLEFYYSNGYRMISLDDYINGIVDVPMGKSPIILTFDDGNDNNLRVISKEDGKIVIDPNSAVGILEEFKKKYPDYGVTATFFVNASLFNQELMNSDILNWLVDNGYDVGNHTMTHCDFRNIGVDSVKKEVGGLYQILDNIIPGKYVNIIALPFGSPYSRGHSNYETILNGNYLGVDYHTDGALRVGWEANDSCFDKEFDPTYLKRIRAYDNNGVDFDIEMNFKILEKKRYISDGDKDTVVVKSGSEGSVKNYDGIRIVTY